MVYWTKSLFVLFITVQILQTGIINAQTNKESNFPRVTAAFLEGDIIIDGRLEEKIWQKAKPVTHFIQGKPVEGAPAEEKTKVSVLYDQFAIYIGAYMYESDPENIADQIVRRDEWGTYDYFEFSFDPDNNKLTGYSFRVSAAGVQRDVYLFDDVREDDSWDAVWYSAVNIDSTGWSIEARIPVSQLGYDAKDSVQTWGVNFKRKRVANNEETYFALESELVHGKVSVFGKLEGLNFSNRNFRLEIRPYMLGSAVKLPSEINNPFNKESHYSNEAGFDLRYGIGDYTLDMTVNPDFGQVEVDPAEVNLTAFETFLHEKRPFFIEDAQIFRFDLSGSRNQLFYGRRIGREPRGSAADDFDYVDAPTQTTILGAVKLTGRSEDGLSVGALTALTQAQMGRAYIPGLNKIEKFNAEPGGFYSVLRTRQEFRNGASQLGGIITGSHQNLPDDGSLDFLNSSAYSYGLDFSHNWGGLTNRDWGIDGHIAGSTINGSSEALIEVQSSSNHYFQRPDAVGYSMDSTATSMNGHEWELTLKKLSGDFTWRFWVNEISPGFEINDVGFFRGSERFAAGGRISYQEIKPIGIFRNYEISLFSDHWVRHSAFLNLSSESLSKAYSNGATEINGEIEFLNYWGFDFGLGHSAKHLSATATRGGPLMQEPASVFFWMWAYSDRREKIFIEPSFSYRNGFQGAGYEWHTELQTTIRPASGWEIQIEPGFNKELNPAQYVETIADPEYSSTFGQRYIFGELRHQTFSLETRVNIAFNPKLTIQFYAQTFVSSGKYLSYKQLRYPESYEFDHFVEGKTIDAGKNDQKQLDFDADGKYDASFENGDFNLRSFKLNGVLRWEYLPGSTLFLVWQHSRFSEKNVGDFDLNNSLTRLWGTQPANAIILKLNYWLNL